MRKIVLALCTIVALCIASSCSILTNNNDEVYLDVEIFQTLGNEALAYTSNGKIVKVITNEDVYYDGKSLSGRYVFLRTYTYETIKGNIKTVPVYIKKSELKNNK